MRSPLFRLAMLGLLTAGALGVTACARTTKGDVPYVARDVGTLYSAAKEKLERRHPETPLAASTVDAGFAGLTAIFRKHRAVIQRALGVEGGFELRRGFHADLPLAAMAASFEADGFVAVPLVFDR